METYIEIMNKVLARVGFTWCAIIWQRQSMQKDGNKRHNNQIFQVETTRWCKQLLTAYGRMVQVYGGILLRIRRYNDVLEP